MDISVEDLSETDRSIKYVIPNLYTYQYKYYFKGK